jgi:hypothetical protein
MELTSVARATAVFSSFIPSVSPLNLGSKKTSRQKVQWFGNAVVVEHRFIWAILEGIQTDGLVVTRE